MLNIMDEMKDAVVRSDTNQRPTSVLGNFNVHCKVLYKVHCLGIPVADFEVPIDHRLGSRA